MWHAALVAWDTWVPDLVYCNFLKKVRSGGWGTEGPKALTLGQYVSACTTFPLGSGSIKGLTQPQNKAYTFAFHGLACVTIQCMRYYIIVLLWNFIYTYEVFSIHRYIPMRYFLFIYLWIPVNNFLLTHSIPHNPIVCLWLGQLRPRRQVKTTFI